MSWMVSRLAGWSDVTRQDSIGCTVFHLITLVIRFQIIFVAMSAEYRSAIRGLLRKVFASGCRLSVHGSAASSTRKRDTDMLERPKTLGWLSRFSVLHSRSPWIKLTAEKFENPHYISRATRHLQRGVVPLVSGGCLLHTAKQTAFFIFSVTGPIKKYTPEALLPTHLKALQQAVFCLKSPVNWRKFTIAKCFCVGTKSTYTSTFFTPPVILLKILRSNQFAYKSTPISINSTEKVKQFTNRRK